jgi:hypothetical protein
MQVKLTRISFIGNFVKFGLYRISFYPALGLYRILLYSGFGIYRILFYPGFGLEMLFSEQK